MFCNSFLNEQLIGLKSVGIFGEHLLAIVAPIIFVVAALITCKRVSILKTTVRLGWKGRLRGEERVSWVVFSRWGPSLLHDRAGNSADAKFLSHVSMAYHVK